MNKEKKESKKSNQERIDACDYLASAASSMDCTGLIPSAPTSRAELEAYEELYPFLPPVENRTKKIPSTFLPPPHMIIKNRSF